MELYAAQHGGGKKMNRYWLPFYLILLLTNAFAADFFVTPAGTVNGDGSAENPWNLRRALSHPPAVRPGDTIWIRGGVYTGRFLGRLKGAPLEPIIVRAYPGENVKIDGNYSTVTTSDLEAAAPYSAGNLAVADAGGLSLGVVIALLDGQGGEEMQVAGINGNVLRVIRGWNGSCRRTGTCPARPAGMPIIASAISSYLTVEGAYTWYWGLEVMYSQESHVLGENNPPWPNFSTAITDQCNGCKFINMVIHDSGANGIFSNASAQSTEIYGSLIFYNGIDDTKSRAHGHGIYSQNTQMGPAKRFLNNVIFRSFGYGVQVFGTSDAYLDNFQLEGNTLFNAGEQTRQGFTRNLLIGGSNVARNLVLRGNYSYFPSGAGKGEQNVGYDSGCSSAAITGNYFVGGEAALSLVNCADAVLSGNTFFGPLRGGSSSQYENNTLHRARPTGVEVFVRPNFYEIGRANITIFNWDRLSAVSVNLSKVGLQVGDAYEVRDVQDFFGPAVLAGKYDGNDIAVPMTGTRATAPLGDVLVQPVHTDIEFGAFVILPLPQSAAEAAHNRRSGRAGSRSR